MATLPDTSDVVHPIGASTSDTPLDMAIAALAVRQHGVVEYRQLVSLGLSAKAIAHRVQTGRLHPVHRGVYAVGHARLTERGRWMAAVLSAGDRAVLSHRSAAALWGLGAASSSRIDVTAPTERRRPGVAMHQMTIEADERTIRDGIPVTTVSRTLLDLAAVAPRRQVERALREAEHQRLGDQASVAVLLDRHRGRKGTKALRDLLDRAQDGITRSDLEEAFLTFLDEHDFARPLLNAHVGDYECDCVWPAVKTVVELDGRAFHDDDHAFERDRERDRALHAAGFRTARVTWHAIHRRRARLERDLSALVPRRNL